MPSESARIFCFKVLQNEMYGLTSLLIRYLLDSPLSAAIQVRNSRLDLEHVDLVVLKKLFKVSSELAAIVAHHFLDGIKYAQFLHSFLEELFGLIMLVFRFTTFLLPLLKSCWRRHWR